MYPASTGLRAAAVALTVSHLLSTTAAMAKTGDKADIVIVNGHVFAPAESGPATAIAIQGDHIVAVGSAGDVARWRGPATRTIDAAGRAILPGFDDNHVHLSMGAKSLSYPDVRKAADLAAIQARIRDQARLVKGAGWIELGGWLPDQLPGHRPDTRMLDAAVADRPVVMWTLDRHGAWLNSKALALLGITDATPNPPNGIIDRDADGHATGWLKEFGAVAMVEAKMPPRSEKDREALLLGAIREAQRYGITALTEALGSPEEYERLDRLRRKGLLTMRVTYAMVALPGISDQAIAKLDAFWKAHPDSDRLRTGTVKMFLDGVPQLGTAYLLHPWGPQASDGEPAWQAADYDRAVGAFDRAGWQIMVHAMGDGAVRLALDGMEKAILSNPQPRRERRFRIEHAFLVDPADYPRFARLNVTAAYQPIDNFRPSGAAPMADVERAPQDNGRWVRLRDIGGRFGFGSDWPVSSLDALARIYTIADSPRRDQRLPVDEIIAGYTVSNAYLDYAEAKRGRIAPGQLADLAIVSTDILSHPPETLDDTRIDATIFNGEPVFLRADSGLKVATGSGAVRR
jgi:predicted amidohydrolase YtcJ